jgi:hypothetical protein
MNQALSERLKYYIEIFRLVWASLLVIGGGVVSLLLREQSSITWAFAITGVILMCVMFMGLLRLNTWIRETLTQMEKQKNG